MFFSSVLVPSVSLPAGRTETLASTRRLPSSMLTLETPSWRTVSRSRRAHCAAAVEVDQRGVGAVDAAGGTDVDRLRRVLLEVGAVDADVAEPAGAADRDVVLADLVGLRAVGIEVVLTVEDRPRRDLAFERESDLQRIADRLLVWYRQHPRVREADWASVDVRLVAEGQLAAAEHLRLRRQLDV